MGILRKMFYTDYICQMKIINNMNENIDLTKILKDCPKGTKFYSPLCGEVELKEISNDDYPIFTTNGANNYTFNKEGLYYADEDGECLLFPSKDQRDWSKFTAPWYKKEKFVPKTLKPFDKVLCKVAYDRWHCDFFSYYVEGDKYPNICISDSYSYCIPYNDDTKHLIGTYEEAPEFYRYWEV